MRRGTQAPKALTQVNDVASSSSSSILLRCRVVIVSTLSGRHCMCLRCRVVIACLYVFLVMQSREHPHATVPPRATADCRCRQQQAIKFVVVRTVGNPSMGDTWHMVELEEENMLEEDEELFRGRVLAVGRLKAWHY